MRDFRAWKILGGLIVLFSLGGVCGAAYTSHRTAQWERKAAATDQWSERWFQQTAEAIGVREDQMKSLRPMMESMQWQLRELQKETTSRADGIIRQAGRRMWEVLDETQREKYHALDRSKKLSRQALSEPVGAKTSPVTQ